jgi:hypothetical protein
LTPVFSLFFFQRAKVLRPFKYCQRASRFLPS